MRRRTFLGTVAAGPLTGTPRYPRLPSPATVWNEEPVAVGFRKQLFVDDAIVSTRHNVIRQQGRPLQGRVVRLKFHLERAKLFAFSVKA